MRAWILFQQDVVSLHSEHRRRFLQGNCAEDGFALQFDAVMCLGGHWRLLRLQYTKEKSSLRVSSTLGKSFKKEYSLFRCPVYALRRLHVRNCRPGNKRFRTIWRAKPTNVTGSESALDEVWWSTHCTLSHQPQESIEGNTRHALDDLEVVTFLKVV